MTQSVTLPIGAASHPGSSPDRGGGADDAGLFGAAQAGDYAAFEEIVRRYHGRIYRLVLGMTKDPSEAEEVAQETFLNVFRHLHGFKQESSPASWIYRVAVNAALMRLRSRRRKPLLSLDDFGAVQGDPSTDTPFWSASGWSRQPEAAVLNRELGNTIERSIDRLPEKYRLVLLLRDVEGNSSEEVAQTLGITVPTVKSRLHRARLSVRHDLEAFFQR